MHTGFEFFEASAKENIQVKQVFERLVDIICDKMSESLENENSAASGGKNLRFDANPPIQQKCSC